VTAEGLQALLAEGCLFGWHLRQAEHQAFAVLTSDPDADEELSLAPRVATASARWRALGRVCVRADGGGAWREIEHL